MLRIALTSFTCHPQHIRPSARYSLRDYQVTLNRVCPAVLRAAYELRDVKCRYCHAVGPVLTTISLIPPIILLAKVSGDCQAEGSTFSWLVLAYGSTCVASSVPRRDHAWCCLRPFMPAAASVHGGSAGVDSAHPPRPAGGLAATP